RTGPGANPNSGDRKHHSRETTWRSGFVTDRRLTDASSCSAVERRQGGHTMELPNTLTCETGFSVVGMQEGENYLTPIRVLSTLVAVSVVSAWCNLAKIKRLSLFFSHWLRWDL
ncbi:unnamed protein product, partial [Ectocarpus sp. 4 AP-2014]